MYELGFVTMTDRNGHVIERRKIMAPNLTTRAKYAAQAEIKAAMYASRSYPLGHADRPYVFTNWYAD